MKNKDLIERLLRFDLESEIYIFSGNEILKPILVNFGMTKILGKDVHDSIVIRTTNNL